MTGVQAEWRYFDLPFGPHVLRWEVLDSLENVCQNLVSIWDNASSEPGVTIVCTYLCSKIEVETAAQTICDSDCLWRVCSCIQANDEIRLAYIWLIMLHVMDKVFNLAFFAAFNRDRASGMAKAETLTGLNWKQSGEESVSVVAATSSVHPVVFNDWVTRVCIPSLAKRLLVHMAVH